MKHILLAFFLVTSTAHGALTKASNEMVSLASIRVSGSSTLVANAGETVLTWDNENWDDLGIFNHTTGVLTQPSGTSARYRVCIQIRFPSGGYVSNNMYLALYKDSVQYSFLDVLSHAITTTVPPTMNGCDEISLTSGQTLSVKASQNFGSSLAPLASVFNNYMIIERIR